MKIFNTLKELWDHCFFCPICQKDGREMTVSVGPDEVFTLISYQKSSTNLDMECRFQYRKKLYLVNYKINCLDNSFIVDIKEDYQDNSSNNEGASRSYFYFYIQSHCPDCNQSSVFGEDIELSFLDKKIYNLSLQEEEFYLPKNNPTILIDLDHMLDVTNIYKCSNSDGKFYIDFNSEVQLPLLNLDFSNQEKVFDKIKTLILFS